MSTSPIKTQTSFILVLSLSSFGFTNYNVNRWEEDTTKATTTLYLLNHHWPDLILSYSDKNIKGEEMGCVVGARKSLTLTKLGVANSFAT